MYRKIIIQEIGKPREKDVDKQIKWIVGSLGLERGRDVEEMSFKIISELLDKFSKEDIVSTEEIANSLGVECARVNHHLRNLLNSGILVREKRKVVLRGGSLSSAIEEMRKDSERMFQEIEEIARSIDEKFGF